MLKLVLCRKQHPQPENAIIKIILDHKNSQKIMKLYVTDYSRLYSILARTTGNAVIDTCDIIFVPCVATTFRKLETCFNAYLQYIYPKIFFLEFQTKMISNVSFVYVSCTTDSDIYV